LKQGGLLSRLVAFYGMADGIWIIGKLFLADAIRVAILLLIFFQTPFKKPPHRTEISVWPTSQEV